MRFHFVEYPIGPRWHTVLRDVVIVRADVELVGRAELNAVCLLELGKDFVWLRGKRSINAIGVYINWTLSRVHLYYRLCKLSKA